MNVTTVKPLPSVKTATASVKCTMAAEESYKVWYQMMREMADKDIKRSKEIESERKVFELAKNMLAKKSQELANAETEIKRLKHEVEILRPIADDGMTNSFLMAQGEEKLANAEAEIKRLKHELHQSKANTQNIPKNDSNEALDALKRITEVDVSGRNAWTASNIMKKIARGVLDNETI